MTNVHTHRPRPISASRAFVCALMFVFGSAQLVHAQNTATPMEIAASELKIRAAVLFIDQSWTAIFREAGEKYATPRIVGFENSVKTACGLVHANNAYACRSDSTVYYDRAFIASMMAGAARKLHTDGDLAAVYPIAHEWGHQLQYMLGMDYSSAPNRVEADADCLAGAVIARASAQGMLEPGDLPETQFALEFVGDSVLATGVWGATIEKINMNAGVGSVPVITNARGNHGNPRERTTAFYRGFNGNMRTCIAGIRRVTQSAVVASTTPIRWYVNDFVGAYKRGLAENKPVIFVSGNTSSAEFTRLRHETLESAALSKLAPYAVFAYSDPSRDQVARTVGLSLIFKHSQIISLLAPNPGLLDEEARIFESFDAESVMKELSTHMLKRGWLMPARAPWLPPLPKR